jgi:putative transposase
MSEDTFGVGPA